MRTVLSIFSLAFVFFCFIGCNEEAQPTSTDQSASNTLESLINPNTESATGTTTATPVVQGSMSINDIWVLSRIASLENYEVNLATNVPMLDIDSTKKTIKGHTGCNSLEGKLKVRGNKLLFEKVQLTSNQECNDKGFEKKLLGSFKSDRTTYKILNDSLFLNVGGGAEFVYRRIRR